MKSFNLLKATLFDSTNASFRLAIEARFNKQFADGNYRDLVYVTHRHLGILNPDIYLSFTYKGATFEESNVIYTSYPQQYSLKKVTEEVKNIVADPTSPEYGFTTDSNGTVAVKPGCDRTISVTDIGKSGNWIGFKLSVWKYDSSGIVKESPCVLILLPSSKSNNQFTTSVLTIDEFLTIYQIIHDLNLGQMQVALASTYLNAPDVPEQNYGYNNYQNNNYNNGNYQQNYKPNNGYQNNYHQNNQNGGGYQQKQYNAGVTGNYTPRYNNGYRPQQQNRQAAPVQQSTPAPQQVTQNKPSLMTPDAIASTPVIETDFDDDDSALADIFNDSNN